MMIIRFNIDNLLFAQKDNLKLSNKTPYNVLDTIKVIVVSTFFIFLISM
jgi:hypothetical protein